MPKMTQYFISVFLIFQPIFVIANELEFRPVAVWTANEVHSPEYAVDKMIDDNPATYACLLDDTRTGTRKNTVPAFAEEPITARFILDLGSLRKCNGIRFVTVNSWKTLHPKNITIFSCDDPQGNVNVRPIREKAELVPVNRGYSASVLWEPIETRYLGIRVNENYQIRSPMTGLLLPRQNPIVTENLFNVQIAEVRIFSEIPDDSGVANAVDVAFPTGRLHNDWMMQDYGLDYKKCFISKENADIEQKMLEKVLTQLQNQNDVSFYRTQIKSLLQEKISGVDPRWKKLYINACEQRRRERLEIIRAKTDKIVYAKHYIFGSPNGGMTSTLNQTDEQYFDRITSYRSGSQLCLIQLEPEGILKHEVLLSTSQGVIRDPNISFDNKTIVFSMRQSFTDDDYHLYTMNLENRAIKQITFSPEMNGRKYPCTDYEPCFTPQGDILFVSSRKVQINDCWPVRNGDIFRCNADGSNIRRLTFDELEVNYPQILNDGRVLFTRWEYNDRNAYFLHPLMTMNPDGTMQTEYCGNNSMYPASYIQARAIPNSHKIISIIGGHHVPSKGKLALVDRNQGTQNGNNIEYVAGASPDGTPGRKHSTIKTEGFDNRTIDCFGQDGAQYQYPFPFDEEHYLVAFCPEGWNPNNLGPYNPPMGIYWMTAEGERELLAFDWSVSCGHPVAMMSHSVPPIKPDQVDPKNNFGTFVVQDIYLGPGLKGIARGTVKHLRVVALEYRAAKIGRSFNTGEAGEGICQTPISLNNGSWDVKHVLGEVDIESDGSVAFKVPARTPVYFQLLDEKGYCVQSMRSWATLQGGETFACLGCHEDKLETTIMPMNRPATIALRKSPQRLRQFGNHPHPLMVRLENENCLDSIENYWGINAPPLTVDPNAPVAGFSYTQEIQPIWDRHCISCHHTGDIPNADHSHQTTLSLTSAPRVVIENVTQEEQYKRLFSESYLSLTNNGTINNNRYIQWLEVRSRSEMLPPYHTGSSKSSLMKYLEPDHYNVHVSDAEKRIVACWIDLLVPYCGAYHQANTWSRKDKQDYLYYLEKRRFFAEQELINVKKSLEPERILTKQ
ncbi:MAG: hypothetical protein LBI18_02830 [Planctomycetaceae bacterium]|jgi:hypothetical protein|nr:hypothetical protein [Planctomycetaceae bacterium]